VSQRDDDLIIRQAPLFSALDDEAASSLRESMASEKLSKGKVLFREGQEGDRLYVVVQGKIKLGTTSGDGRENLLGIFGPGQMFGELSLFDPKPRTATATAVTDSRLVSLAYDAVIGLVTSHPQTSLEVLRRLAQRLRESNEIVSDLVFDDVPGRVAKQIMNLGERFGTLKDDGLHVNHDLTQEELAHLVGASRETVNKSLADFAARGWVKLQPRGVLVTDVERLAKRAR
jgi:CRP/FNR family transcriptional regulator, cyclic AMP receptor protein